MTQGFKVRLRRVAISAIIAALTVQSLEAQASAATAQRGADPEVLLPPSMANSPSQPTSARPAKPAVAVPQVEPVPVPEPVMHWSIADARALLSVIESIDSEGLFAKDYQPEVLRAALAAGQGDALDQVASKSFAWLAEDLRDGRTPMTSREQWFAVDPDQDTNPTSAIMTKALATHDVAGVLAGLDPAYPDYDALKATLAATPKTDIRTRSLIRINMDRWRWLVRDLGDIYLIANVPEFQLRLMKSGNRIVRTYKTVVGKPGKTATPQLAEQVKAVVFNPTWTVPQSIVVGEGLGESLMRAPRRGYKATRNSDGTITVVQQPGPENSLGVMKIDMPNPHAIYLHDTPSKQYFAMPARAYSHGCIRTERALELGMTMAIMGADMQQDQLVANATSGRYTKVPMTRTFPVYITYFTMGESIAMDGTIQRYADIYGRDASVLASFARPREQKTTQRISSEPVVQLDNPL